MHRRASGETSEDNPTLLTKTLCGVVLCVYADLPVADGNRGRRSPQLPRDHHEDQALSMTGPHGISLGCSR